uniref:hypothetical protein n=1 Tax=uncultured Altererythrobacter sp. TaxID=500840 RepID=UPI00263897A1|nr:hypothetical protein [uncultured Altererythrobacter sp.]
MRTAKTLTAISLATILAISASAAPPEGKGGGKGGGNNGGEDPPTDPFVPAIAYFEEGRKSKNLKLANRAGDQACMISDQQGLRGFEYHASSKVLAYSVSGIGVFLTSWGDDPCTVGNGTLIRNQAAPENLDFSPYGRYLVWREPVEDYSGFGTAARIMLYDLSDGSVSEVSLEAWGGVRPEWGVNGEWGVSNIRFSPDFATTNEIIFVGGSLDGRFGEYDSLYTYSIDGANAPKKLLDGASISFDFVFSVTSPAGSGVSKVAFRNNNNGQVVQLPINGGAASSFAGYEPDYSCDNSELIHRKDASSRKNEVRITSADGGSTETWSKASLRFFDWFCG